MSREYVCYRENQEILAAVEKHSDAYELWATSKIHTHKYRYFLEI